MSDRGEIELGQLVDNVRDTFGPKARLFLTWEDDAEVEHWSWVRCDVRMPSYDRAFAEKLFEFRQTVTTPPWFLLTSMFVGGEGGGDE